MCDHAVYRDERSHVTHLMIEEKEEGGMKVMRKRRKGTS